MIVTAPAPAPPQPTPTEDKVEDKVEDVVYPVSPGSSYITIVQKWRESMGLGGLTEDAQLQNNAQKTVNDGQGEMRHELNDGSMAQVLGMGDSNAFENVFVGGWLCERPKLPGLEQACNMLADNFDHQGQTGHADILTNSAYSRIGCANGMGVWSCDLA